MINFALRIQNLQDARAKAHRELDGSKTVLRDAAMAERRNQVEATFQQGLAQLNADYQKEENAIRSEMAKARHASRLARVEISPAQQVSHDRMKMLLPTLTPSELSQAYADACEFGDVGAQVAIETFRPSFSSDEPGAGAALLDLATRRTAQQASRTARQTAELQAAEARLKSLASEYAVSLSPLRDERAKDQAMERTREPSSF